MNYYFLVVIAVRNVELLLLCYVVLVCFFLQWQDVLDIISKALYDNNMVFSQINGISKFQVHKGYFS